MTQEDEKRQQWEESKWLNLFLQKSKIYSNSECVYVYVVFQREEEVARRQALKEEKKKKKRERKVALIIESEQVEENKQDTREEEEDEVEDEDEDEEELPPLHIPVCPSPIYCGFYSKPGHFWLSMVYINTHTHTDIHPQSWLETIFCGSLIKMNFFSYY